MSYVRESPRGEDERAEAEDDDASRALLGAPLSVLWFVPDEDDDEPASD